MSAAAATADAGAAPPAKKGKKKLIIIIAAVVLLLAVAGGGAAMFLKKKAAADAEGGEDGAATSEAHSSKPDLKHPPTFLPLDPFIVNLADADTDRYAQIGITLEVEDAHYGDEMKAFMPAIRNGILMILSHKTSAELKDRPGKELLAGEILREVSRTMGITVEAPAAAEKDKGHAQAGDTAEDEEPKPKKAKDKPKPAPAESNPIKHVHFSNFIVQ